MENIRPWCISRQLWWGHRIPVWNCENIHTNVFTEDNVIADDAKNVILSKIIFNLISDSRLKKIFSLDKLISLLNSDWIIKQNWRVIDIYLNLYKNKYKKDKKLQKEIKELEIIFENTEDVKSIIKNWWKIVDVLENSSNISINWDSYIFEFVCKKCWSKKLEQEKDVLDTWFSSWLWPFSVLWWPDETADFKNFYPNNVLETWYDILFFRIARMVMMWTANLDQKPFSDIYLHWLIRTEDGKKMSKSSWTAIDPLDIIEKYWADSLRLSTIIWITPWNDVRFSEKKVEYNWRFLNKLWNASRYIYIKVLWEDNQIKLDYDELKNNIITNIDKFNDFDKWIINRFNKLIDNASKSMDKFTIWEFWQIVINSVWHDFCDWYIEISKLEKSDHTDQILIYSLWTILKLLHPYIPFITEKLWELLNFDWKLIIADWPSKIDLKEKNYNIDLLMDLISEFRNLKQNSWTKPNEKVDVFIQWSKRFLSFSQKYEKLMIKLLKIENIKYLDETETIWDDDYNISVVIDVKIWLKWIKVLNKQERIELLEKEIKQEKQFMNTIRAVLTKPWFTEQAPQNIVESKKQKMAEVKEKILKLEYELTKLKI